MLRFLFTASNCDDAAVMKLALTKEGHAPLDITMVKAFGLVDSITDLWAHEMHPQRPATPAYPTRARSKAGDRFRSIRI